MTVNRRNPSQKEPAIHQTITKQEEGDFPVMKKKKKKMKKKTCLPRSAEIDVNRSAKEPRLKTFENLSPERDIREKIQSELDNRKMQKADLHMIVSFRAGKRKQCEETERAAAPSSRRRLKLRVHSQSAEEPADIKREVVTTLCGVKGVHHRKCTSYCGNKLSIAEAETPPDRKCYRRPPSRIPPSHFGTKSTADVVEALCKVTNSSCSVEDQLQLVNMSTTREVVEEESLTQPANGTAALTSVKPPVFTAQLNPSDCSPHPPLLIMPKRGKEEKGEKEKGAD